jgi:hypothetical protein
MTLHLVALQAAGVVWQLTERNRPGSSRGVNDADVRIAVHCIHLLQGIMLST